MVRGIYCPGVEQGQKYGLVPVYKKSHRLVGRLGSGVWASVNFQIISTGVISRGYA